jgi:hypothetical protein
MQGEINREKRRIRYKNFTFITFTPSLGKKEDFFRPLNPVLPTKAGIQYFEKPANILDCGFHQKE